MHAPCTKFQKETTLCLDTREANSCNTIWCVLYIYQPKPAHVDIQCYGKNASTKLPECYVSLLSQVPGRIPFRARILLMCL